MFCMDCGTKIPDGAKFCFNCGNKISLEHVSVSGEKSVSEPSGIVEKPKTGMLQVLRQKFYKPKFTYEDYVSLTSNVLSLHVYNLFLVETGSFLNDYLSLLSNTEAGDEREKARVAMLGGFDQALLREDLDLLKWESIANSCIYIYNLDIDCLEEQIENCLLSKYLLTEDNAKSLAKTLYEKHIPKVTLLYNRLFAELSHFSNRQSAYIRNFDTNGIWVDLAKNFASGALIGANPLIGVPLMIANILGQSKQHAAESDLANEYNMHVDRTNNCVVELAEKLCEIRTSIDSELQAPLEEMLSSKNKVITEMLGDQDAKVYYSELTEGLVESCKEGIYREWLAQYGTSLTKNILKHLEV